MSSLFVLASVAFACGLDLVGTPSIDGNTGDAAAEDAFGGGDDGSSSPVGEGGGIDGGDPSADANADAKPACNFLRVVDALTVLDGGNGWVVARDTSNGDHPKIDPSAEGPAVSLISANATSSVGGIWRSPMAIHAFDVSFRYIITCVNLGTCADGIAAMWVESRDGGPPELFPSLSGSTFGMPGPGVRGGAVAFDVHKDTTPNDPVTPVVSILKIDPAKSPGLYDWHVANSPPDSGLVGAHNVSIRVRRDSVSVSVDGVPIVSAVATTTNIIGWFGIGASTGANVGTFFVRSFDGTFYECDEP